MAEDSIRVPVGESGEFLTMKSVGQMAAPESNATMSPAEPASIQVPREGTLLMPNGDRLPLKAGDSVKLTGIDPISLSADDPRMIGGQIIPATFGDRGKVTYSQCETCGKVSEHRDGVTAESHSPLCEPFRALQERVAKLEELIRRVT